MNLYTYVHNNPLIYRDSTEHAIDNIQLNTYLQIARAEGVNSQVYWEIRSILGSEVSGLPGNIANNNKSFKYLFSLATGTYYEKKANTLGNAQWAEGNLQKMFELAEALENVSFAMLSTVGGPIKGVRSVINRTPSLVKAAEKMGKDPKVQKEANDLIAKFLAGNKNPGLRTGTKNLFKNISYLRGEEGARVFFRMEKGEMVILAKANKHNEQAVIDVLTKLYK
ncbi:hypothetical protein [Paenibacillus sp. cl6col]|uniref:hypothetical protein n=1 Tax=Paenibacillus sp. cl6col TaxID=1761878 RepID=UPI0011141010|nr:hypothetical protein [Paenibacillus sp. cl6col]